MTLPTDRVNLAEINDWHVRRACSFYNDKIAEGFRPQEARPQALAYLRRKTNWPEPLAAGAFDSELLNGG